METKERYGRFVLQFEDGRTSAGSFFRAVQLGTSGYERHVALFRTELLIPETAQAVADGLSAGLAVQHAQVARGLEAGRIDKTAFAAVEMFEGRSVGALMERSQAEGHPFAADHALLIVSKAAAALEAAQTRKQIHGFLVPEFIHVSHDGEVSVRAFGLSPRLLIQSNCVGVREARFLAPETEGSGPLDIRADIFSLGAQLFEMLTGSALPRTDSAARSIEDARIPSPGSDGTPIPKALGAVLLQALAEDPARRFKDASAFKKAVDTLLFSGDYSPTTFNLAFFMHTLFRDEGDDDAARIKAEKNADYRAYLVPAPPPAVAASGLTHAPVARPAEPSRSELAPKVEAPRSDSGRSGRVPTPVAPPPAPPPSAQSSGEQPIFQTIAAEKKGFPVAPAVIGAAVLGAALYFLVGRTSTPPPAAPAAAPTMNAAETAALARVRELESRLAALEAEKEAAEEKASEEATRKIEAQAKARGRAVDPAELQRAQEEARKKAQAEQAARVQAERQKIEEERRLAEETRLAEARIAEAARVAEAARLAAATPTLAPTTAPTATEATPAPFVPAPPPPATATATPAPAIATPAASPAAVPAGPALVDLSDPNAVAPVLVSQSRIEYPPVARAQRITGTVVVSALVDEQGNVIETRLIRGVSPNSGLNQAALENVKRRKYKPATLNGRPGRAWVAVQIDFRL